MKSLNLLAGNKFSAAVFRDFFGFYLDGFRIKRVLGTGR